MKKIFIYVLVFAVILSFTACENKNDTEERVKEETAKTVYEEKDHASETEEAGLFSENDAKAMLDGIKNHQPGTAGASLKLCIASFGVLDYAESFGADEKLGEFAVAYIDSLSEEERAVFSDNFSEIDVFCEDLFDSGIESMKLLINDAGNPNKHDEYTKEKYDAVKNIIAEAIA